MAIAALRAETVPDLVSVAHEAAGALETILADAIYKVRARVSAEGGIAARLFDREQRATHGLAWLATYVEAVRQLAVYAARMSETGRSRPDRGTGRAHRARRIPRPGRRGHPDEPGRIRAADRSRPRHRRRRRRGSVRRSSALATTGNTPANRARLTELISAHHTATPGDCGLDETLEANPRRDAQIRRQRGHPARA